MLSNLDKAPEVFIPVMALGENIAKVEQFATGRAIASCDLGVAREYGRLKQLLKEKARPRMPGVSVKVATLGTHQLTPAS